ncbi:MAG: FkbM family methyltransferase [Alistipes sp.]|nr:FkbM family methyltransferase [Alistipes sp.]
MTDSIKRALWRRLSLENYLRVLSAGFFAGLRLGVRSKVYEYPRFLRRVVRRGDVVIDIGANLGYYSREMARLAGPGGKVYAVEPVEAMRRVLERNLRRHSNVEIIPRALGRENRSIVMVNDSALVGGYLGSGRNRVVEGDEARGGVEFEVEMGRGSELFAGLDRLDFIKCDIEGYESVVIPEMAPVIEQHRPIVLLETGGPARRDMIEIFRGWGYAGYVLHKGRLVSVMRAPEKDIVFIPGARHKEFICE